MTQIQTNSKTEKKYRQRIYPYLQAVPDILKFQLLSSILIAAIAQIMNRLGLALIHSTGRVAITSGDFIFLFTTWQGLLLIIVGLAIIMSYVTFELNIRIIISGKALRNERARFFPSIGEALSSARRLLNPTGIALVLFITLIGPLAGAGITISLTRNLYVPTFISSVILDTPLYRIAYRILTAFIFVVGTIYIFTMHGIVLDGLTVGQALKRSEEMIKKNWKNYIPQILIFDLKIVLSTAAMTILLMIIPGIASLFITDALSRRMVLIAFAIITTAGLSLIVAISAQFFIMKLTQLYETYKGGEVKLYENIERRRHPVIVILLLAVSALTALSSFVLADNYDELFFPEEDTMIVAHRAGGIEAPENTVAGIDKACELGAWGCEIDIQRTLDGYYVVNHDGTFLRVAGVDRKVEEMTLEEVKELSVDGEPVPTFEEMLDASEGRVVLLVELKGATADIQMADDAVRMIRERGMTDECIIISLKYDLIDYIENNYPEMQTAYLTFISLGDTAELNCDYLGLEEESATPAVISAIHASGKKVLVWTVNSKDSQEYFIRSTADGIITDYISQAGEVLKELSERSELIIIRDRIFGSVFR